MAIPSKLTKFIRKSFADGPWAIRGGKTTLAWDLRSAKSEEAKPAPLGQMECPTRHLAQILEWGRERRHIVLAVCFQLK